MNSAVTQNVEKVQWCEYFLKANRPEPSMVEVNQTHTQSQAVRQTVTRSRLQLVVQVLETVDKENAIRMQYYRKLH